MKKIFAILGALAALFLAGWAFMRLRAKDKVEDKGEETAAATVTKTANTGVVAPALTVPDQMATGLSGGASITAGTLSVDLGAGLTQPYKAPPRTIPPYVPVVATATGGDVPARGGMAMKLPVNTSGVVETLADTKGVGTAPTPNISGLTVAYIAPAVKSALPVKLAPVVKPATTTTTTTTVTTKTAPVITRTVGKIK